MRRGLSLFLGGLAALWAVGIGGVAGFRGHDPTQLVILQVGQGDCALFRSEGHAVLIDAGPASAFGDAGEKMVVPKLKELGVDELDAILLSHPDLDHVGGCGAVVRAYPRAQILMSDQFKTNLTMEQHFHDWSVPTSQIVWLPERSASHMGPFSLVMECPRMASGTQTNDGSMFVRIADGEASAVFSGDASKEVERAEERLEDWHAEILHVGHHGSHTATDESWLKAVKPAFAVISVGRNNRYGHPAKEVLERLAGNHIKTLRTDRDGDLVFDFDGKRFVRRG